jgi:hypothetical protein
MICDLQPTGETNWQGRAILACTRCPNRIAPRDESMIAPVGCRAEMKAAAKGLGDYVAAAIQFVTLGLVTPCACCKKRQERLNEIGRGLLG